MITNCVKFDWAAKYILRDKADTSIFEELVSVIIGQPIHVIEFIESESNKTSKDDKFNRVDIKAKDCNGNIILVEIQQSFEYYFLQRILFGTAKTITEHIKEGNPSRDDKKVYSINILYFDLGEGSDYLYHGVNQLTGVNTGDTFQISKKEEHGIKLISSKDFFPEYYIVRINQFKDAGDSPLCQWMRYLKEGEIDSETTLPGLKEAIRKLQVINMTEKERKEYEEHLYNLGYQKNVMYGNRMEGERIGEERGEKRGFEKGKKLGIAEGKELGIFQEKHEIALKMKKRGMDLKTIQQIIGLSDEEIGNVFN